MLSAPQTECLGVHVCEAARGETVSETGERRSVRLGRGK